MSGISEWLAALGLERYAPAFHEAEIDVSTVDLLTEEDLRELGIPIGPRRKILASREVSRPHTIDETTGERRQITVMFIDLVGSTNLSTRLDPEVMGELLESYKSAVADEVVGAGGTVAKYLGDGVLAYFGWPKAREDAAECAIHCAFRVRDRIKQVGDPDGEPLQCRTGIATGLVVVGGTTGSGNAREDAIAGEVLNLAARLQALAEPDGICVSARVHELVGQLFDFEFAGEHQLKGFDGSTAAWRPIRQADHVNRFAAKRAVRRTLVGRDKELATLRAKWSEVLQGEGRAALVLGEAGIGKSRLLEELQFHVAEAPHAFVGWQCSAFHQTKPLYPIIERISRAADILDKDDGPTRVAKLTQLIAIAGMPVESALPLFAELLSIPREAGYAPDDLTPTQRRSATIGAIGEWIRRLAEANPMLLVLEDAHWADATTLEVANLLINGLAGLSILVLVTGRPEFAAPWSGRANVSVIGLDRLQDSQCEGLIREIIAEGHVTPAALRQIVEHSDGNPLFVEELSAAFAQSDGKGRQAVPETLQGSLMARLDQLGDAKRTAQLCAVLGRHFARPLLVQLYDGPPALLDTNLSLLVAHDLVHPLGRANEGRYQFKHALLRDAAYESLLLAERRRLHERCARQLEREFPEVAESEPELLAHHFSQAGMSSEAADYLERAGDRATEGAAYREAIASYREALDQLRMVPQRHERERRELAILLKLGPALSIIDGAQNLAVREVYQEAAALGHRIDDLDGRFKAVWGLWYNANVGRDYGRAGECAEELVLLSQQSSDDAHVLEALHCRWSSGMFRGDCVGSVRDAERGMTLYHRDRHHRLAATFGGHDPGVCAYGVAASSQVIAGQIATAMKNVDQAVALAEDLKHPHSMAHALMVGLSVCAGAHDKDKLRKWCDALASVAETYNFPPQRAAAAFFKQWASAQAGELKLEELRSTFDELVPIGPLTLLYVALYAEELLKQRLAEEALSVIDHHLATLKFPFGYYLAEVYRVRGECLGAIGRRDEASEQLTQAYELARDLGSHMFSVRAAMARMRLGGTGCDAVTSATADLDRALTSIGESDCAEVVAARSLMSRTNQAAHSVER
jgi:class 3 adenylate cyclase/tetratricopeptide (TPR) repeat protein